MTTTTAAAPASAATAETAKARPFRSDVLTTEQKSEIKRLHQQWGSPFVRQQLNNIAAFTGVGIAIYTWYAGLWPLTIVTWFVAAHFFHTKPLSLHDASHGTLSSNRRKNGVFGIFCGTVSGVPLSVYRYAHAYHHGFMSSERDPEMWPFNKPGTSRPFRMMCAFLEIVFGFLYTPFLFCRSLFVCGPVKKAVRRRVIFEYALIALWWGGVAGVMTYMGWWNYFLIGYFPPLVIAGAYQTLNKYTEHLGLLGDTVLAGTRTVIPETTVHKTMSNLLQHVDHHGTHHRYAQIPFYHLPEASPIVYGHNDPANPVFPTYHAAFIDMLPSLLNPKAGSQWITWEEERKKQRTADHR
ncbi:fatty acid desaturase family protein [Rubinisphaera sp. JC750]|uniref:fatty acid desaturase family protein n=1 Tax=Rubinisphaera sp. JC750 TaxID=2898658 RepID=UPI001F2E3831|nr:fatty acid desaturase [Rubinisphaera sp. JC750]